MRDGLFMGSRASFGGAYTLTAFKHLESLASSLILLVTAPCEGENREKEAQDRETGSHARWALKSDVWKSRFEPSRGAAEWRKTYFFVTLGGLCGAKAFTMRTRRGAK